MYIDNRAKVAQSLQDNKVLAEAKRVGSVPPVITGDDRPHASCIFGDRQAKKDREPQDQVMRIRASTRNLMQRKAHKTERPW